MDRQTIIDILYKYNYAINPIDYNLFLAEMVNYDDSELEVFRKKTVLHLFFKSIEYVLTTEQRKRLEIIRGYPRPGRIGRKVINTNKLTNCELKEYWNEELMWNTSNEVLIEIFYDEVIKRLRKSKLKKLNEIEKGR